MRDFFKETINDLVEIVYLSQEKFDEMQLNGTLDENTIYITDYNGSITDYSVLEDRIEDLEAQVAELKSLIVGISDTIDNINGEEI